MRRPWIPLALLATSISIGAQAQTQSAQANKAASSPDFSEARQLITYWMAKDSLPGLAVAVSRGDSIIWEEGFGWANRDTRVPATAHTPFYLASVTKTITATAAMILRERGRLDLDRPANAYLGVAHLWSPAWDTNGATVRRLATHTSGLTTFDLGCAAEQPACHLPSLDETIRRYGVLVWPPGEHFDYSNLGYYVLGEVIARAARQDLATFLREEVFRPLGMTHSSLGIDVRQERETAVQYSWTRGALPRDIGARSGASSAYASAHDLALFGAFHSKARRTGTPKVLSDASLDTMQYAVVSATRGQFYGLGWWVEENRLGYRSLLAQGGTDAAQAWLRVIPSERIAVAVLANKGVGFPEIVIDAVLSALLPRYAALRAAQKAEAPSGSGQPASTAPPLDSAFVGTWIGFLRAEEGDVPLEFAVTDSGAVRGTIGSRSGVRLGRARFASNLFRLAIPGDLETADSTSGRRLSFYLRPRAGVLNGTVTTAPRAASGLDGRVSYWVELRKRR